MPGITAIRERKPWPGQVHNPYKLWLEEQAKKRNVTVETFTKQLKENIVMRQDEQDKRIAGIETKVDQVGENIQKIMDLLAAGKK